MCVTISIKGIVPVVFVTVNVPSGVCHTEFKGSVVCCVPGITTKVGNGLLFGGGMFVIETLFDVVLLNVIHAVVPHTTTHGSVIVKLKLSPALVTGG